MPRQRIPEGHGELLLQPPFEQWREEAVAVRTQLAENVTIAGVPLSGLRLAARTQTLAAARDFCSAKGISAAAPAEASAPLLVTGHQPEFFHPGVWVKNFLAQRFADGTGGTSVNLTVDSDNVGNLPLRSPCLRPEIRICEHALRESTEPACFAAEPPPTLARLETFAEEVLCSLGTLPAPAVMRHFESFMRGAREVLSRSATLGEFMLLARRAYEEPAQSTYLELPVSVQAGTDAFLLFFAELARRAPEVLDAYNATLDAHRESAGLRTGAQPFPNLDVDGDLVELPFWHLGAEGRHRVWARADGSVVAHGEVLARLVGDPQRDVEMIKESELRPLPRAVTLTMFNRLFVADLFLHGVGGARYDEVTEDLTRRLFGASLPPKAVASLTLYLPLGMRAVSDGDLEAALARRRRLGENPDQMLDEFDVAKDGGIVASLAEQKRLLVESINEPGTDKKSVGRHIKEVNRRLGELLAPAAAELDREIAELEAEKAHFEVLTEREYAFCLYSPLEVRDQAG